MHGSTSGDSPFGLSFAYGIASRPEVSLGVGALSGSPAYRRDERDRFGDLALGAKTGLVSGDDALALACGATLLTDDRVRNDDLDDPKLGYHYVATASYPYLVGTSRGTPIAADLGPRRYSLRTPTILRCSNSREAILSARPTLVEIVAILRHRQKGDERVNVFFTLKRIIERSMEEGQREGTSAKRMAEAAMVSRSAWYRRMRAKGLERPVSAHRRLQLERAAWHLVRTNDSVSELGLGAGFAYTSAFTRAFRRAYGLPPRVYRRCTPSDWRIPPLDGIHYAPAEPSLSPRQGKIEMKLIELWLESQAESAARLVTALASHPKVEKETAKTRQPFPWLPSTMTVDDLANRTCGFAEPWIHLLDGGPATQNDGTLSSRLAQIKENRTRLQDLVLRFEDEGSWDMTFVDHECEPPQTFSYGSVVLMIMVFTDHARVELDAELRERGLVQEYTALS